MRRHQTKLAVRPGFTILELLAVLTLFGALAVILIPRATAPISDGERDACLLNRGQIELQVQLWRRNHGTFPDANLANIGANPDYFPQGLPTCPVDGTSYAIDTTTGRVTAHSH